MYRVPWSDESHREADKLQDPLKCHSENLHWISTNSRECASTETRIILLSLWCGLDSTMNQICNFFD